MPKRRKTLKAVGFQKGHPFHKPKTDAGHEKCDAEKFTRLKPGDLDKVEVTEDGKLVVRDAKSEICDKGRYLRPSTSQSFQPEDTLGDDIYCLVHIQKMSLMWNRAFREHTVNHPGCDGNLNVDMRNSTK